MGTCFGALIKIRIILVAFIIVNPGFYFSLKYRIIDFI